MNVNKTETIFHNEDYNKVIQETRYLWQETINHFYLMSDDQ